MMSSSFLVVALVFAGCLGRVPASPGPEVAAAESEGAPALIELRLDETVHHQDLELRWLDLQDSRCPTGVQCIWEGRVVVTVEVTRGEDEPIELELELRAERDPGAARAFGHEVVLRGVEPYPRDGATPERSDYVAVVEITEP